jgi:hypothetical protein
MLPVPVIIIFFSAHFVCLANNVVLKKSVSLSKQMTLTNTYYEIIDDFDLKGKSLTVPANSTLDFRGGSIRNGEIVFNGTSIKNPSFKNMHFRGNTQEEYFDIVDYGAESGVKTMDCALLINEIIALQRSANSDRNAKTIHIPNGTFYIKSPIVLWAGWESPITLEGNGNTSTICQMRDNGPIIKHYESHYVKGLRLTYDNRQSKVNNKAVAIACQRAIFSLFENLTICKAYTAFGYINVADQKHGINPTGYKEQCYVSCNFRNIRIYETSGYAFDFKKEFPQGDSGSAYDNIYISCYDWLGNTRDNVQAGALRGDNTVACFTQLNIEGANYTGTLIDLSGMSRVSVESLHLEGIKNIPSIAKVQVQSVVSFNIIDVQACEFSIAQYNAIDIRDNGFANVKMLTLRQDCKKTNKVQKLVLTNNSQRLKIEQKVDAIKMFN